MVKNINIDINSVESIINGAVSDIGTVQDDINNIYSDLNKHLSEAFGDEADALINLVSTSHPVGICAEREIPEPSRRA